MMVRMLSGEKKAVGDCGYDPLCVRRSCGFGIFEGRGLGRRSQSREDMRFGGTLS